MDNIERSIENYVSTSDDPQHAVAKLRELLHRLSPQKSQPIDLVRWVPIERVAPNDYNPNSVASAEMELLYTSILHDGYTQPVVVIWDDARDVYVIVDGFHRYFTCKNRPDIKARNNGLLPVVVIEKDINERMAATVRHNRARGSHSLTGMSSMVFQMLENGWSDSDICAEVGLEIDELSRLKHTSGFSKLFEEVDYQKEWKTKRQLRQEQSYTQGQS